jgi:WD40 repeat protein
MFDTRTGHCELTMGKKSASGTEMPVEQVLMFPSGTAALAASGPIIRVWDIVAGGRCIRALSNHQKTVTSLSFNSNADRLLTAGLDQMVKVYDVSTYKVVHTIRYPAPILCLATSVSKCCLFDYYLTICYSSLMNHTSLSECRMVLSPSEGGNQRLLNWQEITHSQPINCMP